MQKFAVVYRWGDRMHQQVGQLEFEMDETQPGNILKAGRRKSQRID